MRLAGRATQTALCAVLRLLHSFVEAFAAVFSVGQKQDKPFG
jgi:hypothetical protein